MKKAFSKPFICENCLDPVREPGHRIEERLEYRRVSDQARYKVILKRHLCKACVDRIVNNERSNRGEQLSFGG